MRGKLGILVRRGTRIRITPAGAGKTSSFACQHSGAEDHPRRCGENFQNLKSDFMQEGSPPQVRGKLGFWLSLRAVLRITPAGAGKTSALIAIAVIYKDHPRRCGENQRGHCLFKRCRGSPPQVRGKRHKVWDAYEFDRITPAGAGKTKIFDAEDVAC